MFVYVYSLEVMSNGSKMTEHVSLSARTEVKVIAATRTTQSSHGKARRGQLASRRDINDCSVLGSILDLLTNAKYNYSSLAAGQNKTLSTTNKKDRSSYAASGIKIKLFLSSTNV